MGKWRRCYIDYQTKKIWENIEYEHAGMFFSNHYKNRGDLFEGLSIWEKEEYRQLQGTYPVISLSFANIKADTYEETLETICENIACLYDQFDFLIAENSLKPRERKFFESVDRDMGEGKAGAALHNLSGYLSRYYGQGVLILLDEYDTPMQEAYVKGYWDKIAGFMRNLFNSTFKTNPYMYQAVMTGITRVSKESIFSDFNNVMVVTTTSTDYMTAFGFTEEEVFQALEEQGMEDKKEEVKAWYDGFVLGLLVELKGKYHLSSNRESGLGRYDIMLEPLYENLDAIVIEFKVYQPKKEKVLLETLASALAQIEEKQYDAELLEKGIPKERIHHYGFAFEGKKVLIGRGQ